MLNNNIIVHEDKAYSIIRILPLSAVSKKQKVIPEVVEEWKKYLDASDIVQNGNKLIFVKLIPEAEYEIEIKVLENN